MTKSKDIERRKAQRFPILATFSLFCVIPAKGPYRLKIHDLSHIGVGFDVDLSEEPSRLGLKVGDIFDFHLYVNQSLFIPLSIRVARIQDSQGNLRMIGAEFVELSQKGETALRAFVDMIDAVAAAHQ